MTLFGIYEEFYQNFSMWQENKNESVFFLNVHYIEKKDWQMDNGNGFKKNE